MVVGGILARMEEIEEVLKKFKLSNTEHEGIWLGEDDLAKGVEECSLSLIGKVGGEKIANSAGMKSFATNMWSHPKQLKVTEIGKNMFQFIFTHSSEMERVLNGRPWIYDGQQLVLHRRKKGIEDDTKAFDRSFIWVQIWNLLLHWITKEDGKKIESIFCSVQEMTY